MENAGSTEVVVINVSGEVVAVTAQGEERAVAVGDKLQAGEMIIAPAESSVEINLGKAETETVPAETAAILEVDPTTGEITLVIHTLGSEGIEVADIQQAILEGQDPTELLEETAAGNTPPTRAGFSPFQDVDRTAEEVIAQAGFDTTVEDQELVEFPEYEGEFVAPNVAVPTVTIADAAEDEGDTLVFDVALNGNSEIDYDVDFTLSDGTATVADSDYTNSMTVTVVGGALNGTTLSFTGNTVTVPSDATSLTIAVDTTADDVLEGAETVTVTGQTSSMASADSATGTIHDDGSEDGDDDDGTPDNDTPTVTIADAAEDEGDTLVFDVALNGNSEIDYDVDFTLSDGTATVADSDYTNSMTVTVVGGALNGTTLSFTGNTVTVPSDATSLTIAVDTTADDVLEGAETVTVTGQTSSMASADSATGTIHDDGSEDGDDDDGTPDDDTPTITVHDVTVTEGTDTHAIFKIDLSNESNGTTTVNLLLTDGTAKDGVGESGAGIPDYSATIEYSTDNGLNWTTGTQAEIPANTTTDALWVRTAITDDAVTEISEQFTLTVTTDAASATPAIDTGAEGTGTINDDDNAPDAINSNALTLEDTTLTFNASSFGFNDVDAGNSLQMVRIESLPSDGKLFYDGTEITVGTLATFNGGSNVIDVADIGLLTFEPDLNDSGYDNYNSAGEGDQQNDYDSFSFSVSDGANWSATSAVMTIDVTPDADAPSLTVNGTQASNGDNLIDQITVPGAIGLLKTVHTNTGEAPSLLASTTLESISDGLTGGVTTVETQPYRDGGNGPDNIAVDSIEVTTGVIYLEAGTTLSFSGYNDDALLIELGGNTLIHTTGDAWGNYDTSVVGTNPPTGGTGTVTTTGDFTAATSGYYTFEMYIYNHAGPGDLSVNVSVNGGADQPLDTAGLQIYPDITAVDAADGQHSEIILTAGTDGGYYPVELNTGVEGSSIKLTAIDAALVDTDGSEVLSSIVISSIPDGSTLTDGTNTFTATAGNTTVDVTGWNLDNLSYTGHTDVTNSSSEVHTLVVTATSDEIADGVVVDSASSIANLNITVLDTAPVAINDQDNVGVNGVSTGNVLTDGEADLLNTVDAPVGDNWITAVEGQAHTGGDLVIQGAYGTLTIDQQGDYSYQSKLVAGSVTGSVKQTWTDAGVSVYGFDEDVDNLSPFLNGDPAQGLVAGSLDNTHESLAYFNGTSNSDLGVSDNDVDTDELIVFDLNGSTSTAEITLTDFSDGNSAQWHAFDSSGTRIGTGTISGSGNNSTQNKYTLSANLDASKFIQYLVIDPVVSDLEVRGLSFSVDDSLDLIDSFDYTITDEDGDSSSATLTIDSLVNTLGVNDTASVSEAGLSNGSQALTDLEIATGNLLDNDLGVGSLTNISQISSNGNTDSTPDANGVLTVTTQHGTIQVYTQDYNGQSAGYYEYELTGPTNGDNVSDSITYTVSGAGGANSTATLTVNVADDQPTAAQSVGYVNPTGGFTTNLVFVLDRSGSMGTTRMNTAKDAISKLVAAYDDIGDVNILLVSFASNSTDHGWLNATTVDGVLTTITSGGSTNYEAGIDEALDAINFNAANPGASNAPSADQTLAYFLSDGNANAGNLSNVQSDWNSFVTNQVDKVFSFGVGSNVSLTGNSQGSLNAIAAPDPNGVAKVVADSDLVAEFVNSVNAEISGSLSVSGVSGEDLFFGADGGYVESITVNGTVHSYNAATQSNDPSLYRRLFTTAEGAELVFNFKTGEYTYTIPQGITIAEGTEETFAIVLRDNDGDVINTSSLKIIVKPTLEVNDEIIITNLADTAAIDDGVLLQNDLDLNGADLQIQSGSRTNNASTIDYTVEQGQESAAATASVSFVAGNTLTGTSANEMLVAGAGDDTLNGGAGDDILTGGAGDDLLIGGIGEDVFDWNGGDQAAPGSTAIDTVDDFAVADDKLDLSDLLDSLGMQDNDPIADYLSLSGTATEVTLNVQEGPAGTVTQQIVLDGVDINALKNDVGVAGGSDEELLNKLIADSKLII